MAFGDILANARGLTNAIADGTGKFLDEFNEALPTMRALGFTIKDFHMSMALMPEISAKLIASVDTINVAKINELIAAHKEQKLLVALLKALEAAYHVKEQLGDAAFRNVELDITLGLPPRVSVGFGKTEAAAKLTAAAAHS